MSQWLDFFLFLFIFPNFLLAEDIIFHEKFYPNGNGPFHAIILLHTSGRYFTIKKNVRPFVNKGYAVYITDIFVKYGITKKIVLKLGQNIENLSKISKI